MSSDEIAYVDPAKCDRNPGCPASYYCPSEAFQVKKIKEKRGFFGISATVVESIKVNEELCTGCGTCMQLCPHEAISLRAAVVG